MLGLYRDLGHVNKDHDYECTSTEYFDNGLPRFRIEVIREGNKVYMTSYSQFTKNVETTSKNHEQQIKFQSRFLSAMQNLSRCGIRRKCTQSPLPVHFVDAVGRNSDILCSVKFTALQIRTSSLSLVSNQIFHRHLHSLICSREILS